MKERDSPSQMLLLAVRQVEHLLWEEHHLLEARLLSKNKNKLKKKTQLKKKEGKNVCNT